MLVRLRTVLLVLLSLVVLAGAGGAIILYTGVYNVSALKQHTAPVYALLNAGLIQSVKARAEDIAVPELGSMERVSSGLVHYRAHCLQCHGAPGVAPDSFAIGLKPMPANLAATAREWSPAELFWVVKHGIKMSGMPAWEYTLSDEAIWDVVAFVEYMPTLSPVEYAVLEERVSQTHKHGQKHMHEHADANRSDEATASMVLGDVSAGRRATGNFLCATCHHIPGIVGPSHPVGPPLDGIGSRQYIGGVILNTPENMVRWLQHPQEIDPLSAMPSMGLSDEEARDIAAFLYTLDTVK
jgi:mono/diheme cytochrome c family protein